MKTIILIVVLVTVNNILKAQTAEKYYELGHKCYLESRMDSAGYYLQKSMTADQYYAPPYRDAGQMMFNAKQYDNAYIFLNIYETLMEESKKEDNYYYYWYMKGILILQKGYEKNKAVDYFNKSLLYKEDYFKTHFELVDLLVSSEPEKAIYHYKRAKELDENFSLNELDFLNKLAEGYLITGNFNKAIEYYEKILEITPNDLKIESKIALIYKNDLKDNKNAEVRLRKILEKTPQNGEIIVELAQILLENNQINEAILMFSKIEPTKLDFGTDSKTYSNREYCLANYYLTKIYIDKKDKPKATETLEKMRRYFGLSYDNLSHSYNYFVDVIEKME